MPTQRRRYQITETEDVARAIDAAALRWPGESRAKLAVRAIIAGGETLGDDAETASRRAAIERIAGSDPLYPADYLAALRAEWPE